jgi:hypothetical protein
VGGIGIRRVDQVEAGVDERVEQAKGGGRVGRPSEHVATEGEGCDGETVRAHANGIDVFDISNPAAPSLAGKVVNAGISTTGVGVKMAGASRAVRAYSSGLDQYDLTNPAAPTRTGAGPLNVGLSTSRASVALFANNTRAVRSTSSGIEVFDITSNPVRLGLAAGDPSATGTDVVIATSGHAVRTSDEKVEVFDVTTTPTSPTLLGSVSVTSATTGVCIVNR